MVKNTHKVEFVPNPVIMTNNGVRTTVSIIQSEPFSKALEKLLSVGHLK